jgi:hypothetical protein
MSHKAFCVSFVSASLLGCAVLAHFSFDLPTWSEEREWLLIGKSIAAGERLDPIAPKSDYPSSFQAFPIGLVIASGAPPLLASRLVAVLYAVVAAFFFGRIAGIFSNHDPWVMFSAMVLSLLTYSTAFYVMTGWHEVTHVNLLCAASTYFMYSLLEAGTKSIKRAIALGAALGLSMWTLYTPALAACGLVLILSLLPPRFIPWRIKCYVFGALVLTGIPLVIRIIESNGVLLHRHFLWLFRGGEWENTQYSPQNLFGDAMIRTLGSIGEILRPQGGGENFDSSIGVFPEWTLVILGLFGFFVVFFNKRQFFVITLPFFMTCSILILSNTTRWRASILGFYVVLYAIIGLSNIENISLFRKRRTIFCGTLMVLLIVHISLFISPLKRAHRVTEEAFSDGRIARDILQNCGAFLDRADTIGASDHFSLILLEAMLSGTKRFSFNAHGDTETDNLNRTTPDTLIVVSGSEDDARNLEQNQHRIVCEGDSQGSYYYVATTISALR